MRAAKATGTKGAVMATFADTISEPVAERLMEDGVAMLAGIDDGVAAVKAAVDIGAAWQTAAERSRCSPTPAGGPRAPVSVLDEAASKRLLAEAGVPVPGVARRPHAPTRRSRPPRSSASPSSSRRWASRTSPTWAACAWTCAAPRT